MYRKQLTIGIVSALLICVLAPTPALAVDNSYVPNAGGVWNVPGNWSLGHCPITGEDVKILVSGNAHKAVDYNWTGGGNFSSVTVDGSTAGFYGAIWHLANALTTTDMNLGQTGPAWHWMEGPAFLWVNNNLNVGYYGDGPGHFYMSVVSDLSAGLYVGDICYVGYHATGDFDHVNGFAEVNSLYVGQNATGTYWLKDGWDSSELTVHYHAIIGNGTGGVGTFEQTGGTFDQLGEGGTGITLGLNAAGDGTYLMKGGVLNCNYISVASAGDGFFTQSGGTVNTTGDVVVGSGATADYRACYKLNENDGTAELNIGDDLRVGVNGLAKYEQYAGTAIVTDDLEIWQGDTGGDYSYVYLGTNAGLLEVNGSVTNHSGYYDQDGGVMTTPSFTNDSLQGFNLDNNADFRATTVEHNDGYLYMWRNAHVRGEYIGGGYYYMCNFTNNSNVQMGNSSFNGGTFVGHMTNNGSFNYTQGDFSGSTLTNNGTVNLFAPFTCYRLVQNAYSFTVTPTAPITANGTGYASAFESNGNLTIQDGASITVVGAPLVSNAAMYAGGTVSGDVENNDYLLPSTGSAIDEFYIDGDFTQSGTGMLRVRLSGNMPVTEFDRLRLTGHATLGGTLQVLLVDGFTPDLGDSFRVVLYSGGHTGEFDTLSLPALPNDWEWDVKYLSGMVQLDVVEPQECPGDLDGDNDVDLSDLAILLAHYGTTSGATYEDGDLDGDGDVDLADLAALLSVYGTTCP